MIKPKKERVNHVLVLMPGSDQLYPGLVRPPSAKPGVFQEDEVLQVPSNPRLLAEVVDQPLLVVGPRPILANPLTHQVG